MKTHKWNMISLFTYLLKCFHSFSPAKYISGLYCFTYIPQYVQVVFTVSSQASTEHSGQDSVAVALSCTCKDLRE